MNQKTEIEEITDIGVNTGCNWGHAVVAASFMCNLIVDGIMFSFGMFMKDIKATFKVSNAKVSLAGSMLSGFYLMAGPFASALANHYGFRLVAAAGSVTAMFGFMLSYFVTNINMLYITFGFIGGTGLGLIYIPSVVTIGFYFERWRALATGIGVCGSGFGTFIFAPLSAKLDKQFGWRYSFLILGLVVLSCAFFGALFRPIKSVRKYRKSILIRKKEELELNKRKKLLGYQHKIGPHQNMKSESVDFNTANEASSDEPSERKKITTVGKHMNFNKCRCCQIIINKALFPIIDVNLLKSPTFVILAASGSLTMMGFYVPFLFVTDRAIANGMNSTVAIWLMSTIGITNTIGRLLCGLIGSMPKADSLLITNTALTINGLVTLLSGFSKRVEYQFVYSALFGLSISCFATLRSIIVIELLGLENLTKVFGLLCLFQGIATMFGSPLAGALKDATGNYDASFYFSGSLIILSAIMCYPLKAINRWERRRPDSFLTL